MPAEQGMPAKILAQFIDLTVARVGQLAKEGIITKMPNGRYPNGAITQYIKYIRDAGQRRTDYSECIDEERHRQLKRENDIAEGKYESVEVLADALGSIVAQMMPVLESLPLLIKRHWPEVTGDQITLVKKAIAECRNVMATTKL